MTSTTRRGLFVLIALPALAGCGSGDPTYYTLETSPGQPRRGGPSPIEVRTPSVASFLDRDYIVQSTQGYKLELAGNDAWAEPIADMIARVLTSDLAQRLPDTTVYRSGSAIGATPAWVVELVVDRFDEDRSGAAVVHASLVVREAGAASISSVPIALSEMPASSRTTDLVAALSHLLGAVADRASDRLLAGGTGAMPLASG